MKRLIAFGAVVISLQACVGRSTEINGDRPRRSSGSPGDGTTSLVWIGGDAGAGALEQTGREKQRSGLMLNDKKAAR